MIVDRRISSPFLSVWILSWLVGDLVAWSNRLVIHTPTPTGKYKGRERLHTRIKMRIRCEDAPLA